ncbi:MAG: hypothetical protein ABEJ04_05985 [Halobacteriaceae archaeon]
MNCPQCDGTLSTYTFDEREAFVCERCGYVGIEADHHGDPVEVESWTDALRRFYRESDAEPVGSERTSVEHAFDDAGVDVETAEGNGQEGSSTRGEDSPGRGSRSRRGPRSRGSSRSRRRRERRGRTRDGSDSRR